MTSLIQPVPIPTPKTTPSPAKKHGGNQTPLSASQLETLVREYGYTPSLARSLEFTKQNFALRYWIVDNSYSMSANDGHRILGTYQPGAKNVKMMNCTRWKEIQDCVEHRVRLASLLEAPTRFRLLNEQVKPHTLSIAEGSQVGSNDEVQSGLRWIRAARPDGLTPLTDHIRRIYREIKEMEPQLRRSGQRVSITIATDGLPTDRQGFQNAKKEFVEALRTLEGLPVWVVIRLCTDDDKVVDFYNNLDEILELSLDVLDDFEGEAKEVYEVNPWLNYTLPLHRMREMGHHDRLFDLIDERKLTKNEIRDFCILLFGHDHFDGAPDPAADWKGFMKVVERAVEATPEQWNPIKKHTKPLVDTRRLNRMYGGRKLPMIFR